MSLTTSNEEEEKSKIYKAIYDTKLFLKVYNRNIKNFDIQFPKASFDRIIKLYGTETTLPLSFVLFTNPFHMSEIIKNSSRNINVRTSDQIDNILDFLDNYYIYPISYENMDELEKIKIAPRLKTKHLKNIASKMGLEFSEMINYISLQVTEIDVKETTRTIISIQVYQMVFNMIHLLNVKIPEKEPYEFTFYSYRKILKMAGIELDKIIPYLDVLKSDNHTRPELIELENRSLLDKVQHRELKDSIDPKLRDNNLDLYLGIESCEHIPKPLEFDLELDREEASKLLLQLIEELENKNKKEEPKEEEEEKEEEAKEEVHEEANEEEKPKEEEPQEEEKKEENNENLDEINKNKLMNIKLENNEKPEEIEKIEVNADENENKKEPDTIVKKGITVNQIDIKPTEVENKEPEKQIEEDKKPENGDENNVGEKPIEKEKKEPEKPVEEVKPAEEEKKEPEIPAEEEKKEPEIPADEVKPVEEKKKEPETPVEEENKEKPNEIEEENNQLKINKAKNINIKIKGEGEEEKEEKEKEEPEPNINLKGNSVTMINNENDKKDNENPEIQEIAISGDNKPKDGNEIKNEEPDKEDNEEIFIPEIKVEIQNIEEKEPEPEVDIKSSAVKDDNNDENKDEDKEGPDAIIYLYFFHLDIIFE